MFYLYSSSLCICLWSWGSSTCMVMHTRIALLKWSMESFSSSTLLFAISLFYQLPFSYCKRVHVICTFSTLSSHPLLNNKQTNKQPKHNPHAITDPAPLLLEWLPDRPVIGLQADNYFHYLPNHHFGGGEGGINHCPAKHEADMMGALGQQSAVELCST